MKRRNYGTNKRRPPPLPKCLLMDLPNELWLSILEMSIEKLECNVITIDCCQFGDAVFSLACTNNVIHRIVTSLMPLLFPIKEKEEMMMLFTSLPVRLFHIMSPKIDLATILKHMIKRDLTSQRSTIIQLKEKDRMIPFTTKFSISPITESYLIHHCIEKFKSSKYPVNESVEYLSLVANRIRNLPAYSYLVSVVDIHGEVLGIHFDNTTIQYCSSFDIESHNYSYFLKIYHPSFPVNHQYTVNL